MLTKDNVSTHPSQVAPEFDILHPSERLFLSEDEFLAREKEQHMSVTASHAHQVAEESVLTLEKETSKKITEGKLKYKKLKQKLAALSQQFQEQGLLKEQKDITSPNKSRLMKLSLELEKSLKTQAIDYPLVESILREIQKIVEHRREHDILILRGARFMSTLLTIIKRFPSLHRSEAQQSMAVLDSSLKLLRIMLSLSTSREALIVCNQMASILSLLSCALMRDEKKIAVSCFYLLNVVISGPNRIEIQPLLCANIEYILCSSLLKRLKCSLETCLFQDDPSHAQFMLLAFKFYYLIVSLSCEKQSERPIYHSLKPINSLTETIRSYLQSGAQLLTQSLIELVNERDTEGDERYILKEELLPNFKINILLYILKTLNILFYEDVITAQKAIDCSRLFTSSLLFIFEYSKENYKESVQLMNLCSEIIIFIGHLAFENVENQEEVRISGLLESLCNHPLEYIMEPTLRNILIPTFCCLINDNKENFKQTFKENSVQPILQYIDKEICNRRQKQEESCPEGGLCCKNTQCRTLSRKTSVSSINSAYSKASISESYSTKTSNSLLAAEELRLEHRFRPQLWEKLACELRQIDD